MGSAVPVTGRAVLVGPCTVRSSRGAPVELSDRATEALAAIDDELTLIDERPVAVAALWREVLSAHGDQGPALLVCPSWWSDHRIETVLRAARATVGDISMSRRPAMLAQATSRPPSVVVEIAESLVALTRPPDASPMCVLSREGDPVAVAEEVARQVAGRSVVLDRPDGVGGAADLGAMIHARLRSRGLAVTVVDDDRLLEVACSCAPSADGLRPARGVRTGGRSPWRAQRLMIPVGGVAATGVLFVAVAAFGEPRSSAPGTTLLIEGHVAVEVPATWSARRVTAGPGSARLEVSSPSDPQAALHITQSQVPKDETLERTADTLQRALQSQPPGVFVDFNPDDRRGDRPAVTYREIRAGHDILWAVLLDGEVRISVGCQSARGSESAVLEACERATSSVRDIGKFAGTVAAHS